MANMPEPMYFVAEFPEVFADACLRDSAGTLKFLSAYGRDGSIMQFEAALQLGHKESGVCRFHLVGTDGVRHAVEVGNADWLTKFSGRLPRQNLFGPLTQVWMYDKALVELDRANRIGWAMHRTVKVAIPDSPASACVDRRLDGLLAKAWELTLQLSPVALAAGWKADVQAWCLEKNAYERLDGSLYPAIGNVDAMRVSITDHFLRFVSEQVKRKVFVI